MPKAFQNRPQLRRYQHTRFCEVNHSLTPCRSRRNSPSCGYAWDGPQGPWITMSPCPLGLHPHRYTGDPCERSLHRAPAGLHNMSCYVTKGHFPLTLRFIASLLELQQCHNAANSSPKTQRLVVRKLRHGQRNDRDTPRGKETGTTAIWAIISRRVVLILGGWTIDALGTAAETVVDQLLGGQDLTAANHYFALLSCRCLRQPNLHMVTLVYKSSTVRFCGCT
jgi:hypothetical protein